MLGDRRGLSQPWPLYPLSMFSIIQPLFLQKTKPLYHHPKYLFEFGLQRIRDLAFVCP